MSCVCAFFNNTTRQIQSRLETYIPEIPKDAVEGILRSFACSFTVSTLLSNRSLAAGLTGGGLATLATVVHIAFMTGIKNLQNSLCRRFNKPNEALSFECRHSIFLLTWAGTLYLGQRLGLRINHKASFFATIPFLLWNNLGSTSKSPKTPVMGTIVV